MILELRRAGKGRRAAAVTAALAAWLIFHWRDEAKASYHDTGPAEAGHYDFRDGAPTTRAFDGIRMWSEYITMRDRVRLAADIYLPKGLEPGERTATILHVSRYYRSVDLRGLWKPFLGFGAYALTERDIRERFVKAGYSRVDVDVRGSGASFGRQDYPFSPEEVRDGADLVDWIVRQSWSAGVVGATGSSYDGVAASLLLRNQHPAVKAVVPRFTGWDVYEDIFFPGGLQARSLLHDWARLTAAFDRSRLADVFGWTSGLVASGVRPVDARLLPIATAERKHNADVARLLGSIVYRDDDPTGRGITIDAVSPHAIGEAANRVPVFAYAGWFDGALARAQIRQYVSNVHPGSRLLVGPWFHGGDFNASPYAGGKGNDFDHAGEMIRFFDYHLRGIDNGFGRMAPVRYYTMGAERWNTSRTWPPPGAQVLSLHLAADRRLKASADGEDEANRLRPDSAQRASSGKQGFRLRPLGFGGQDGGHEASSHEPAASDVAGHQADTYTVDPTVTSGPGSRWGLIVGTGNKRGYADRRAVDRRLLTYTTPPLERDLEVTGHPTVRLFLSANATDAAVFCYLEDVRPNGEVTYVTEGQLRLLHRQARLKEPVENAQPPRLFHKVQPGTTIPVRTYRRADALPLTPGDVTEVAFDLLPTSFRFAAGHAIRLAIAGADTGTFAAPLLASPLVYEVHRDALHPSRLELPIYPTSPVR